MKNIAIIYQYFAHYRLPVLKSLSQCDNDSEYRFYFFSDNKSNIPSIKLINKDIIERSVEHGGIRWERLKNHWLMQWGLWQRGVLKIAWSSKYSAVIFLGDKRYLSTWVGALLAKWRGKKVFFWSHGYRRLRGGIQGMVIRLFYRIPHAHLFYGHRAVDLAIRDGLDGSRLFVIYNSLDFPLQQDCANYVSDEDIEKVRNRFIQPALPLLVFSGRLTASKMVDRLFRAQSVLSRSGNNFNALIIGGGPARDSLISLQNELMLKSQVLFYGECYEEQELAKLYLAGDVFVLPGALGLSGIHAMGYGLPVITNDHFDSQGPEFEAIIPNITGDFYRAGDLDSLIESISKWIAKAKSERDQIREACIARIGTTYTADNQVKCILYALRKMNV